MAVRKVWEYTERPPEISGEGKAKWWAMWGMDCPGDNAFWSQYILMAYDLTSDTGEDPTIYREGMTHEFMVFAINPDTPLPPPPEGFLVAEYLLHPANMAYQFPAASDAEAHERLQHAVNQVGAGLMSPDTDHRAAWDILFSDGFPLVRSAL